ncbi:MAG: AMP-binding protein [Chloroflexi bacterium]|nr:AMP-binding protein [Chloroflexota bacterium]
MTARSVPATLPQQLRANAAQFGDAMALREKRFGIWLSITWTEYLTRVRNFALGLHRMGFQRGDRIAILGDNRPEWVIAEVAAQALGGASIGIYQDSVVSEVAYIIDLCQARFIVVEDQEQVDKLLDIWDDLETVESLIYFDPRGLRHYDADFLVAFPDVESDGAAMHAEQPAWFDEQVNLGKSDDTAIISTTSGTTSKPKLALISHGNLLSMADGLAAVDHFKPQHEFVSFLPLAWIGEQMMSMACGMRIGFALNFPEEPETVQHDLREIGPHIMFAPPRIWENMLSTVQVKIEDADRVKRTIFNWALTIGRRAADLKFANKSLTFWQRAGLAAARLLVFHNLLDQLGLRRIKWAYTAGAALGPDVFRFFHGLGVNLKQGYGQTETTGICVIHRDDDIKFQTVGTAMPGAEVTTDNRGEILVRGPMCFSGYFNNPEATTSALTEDGWVRTGDAGYFDEDGHLIVIDRAKDVMTLHDGTRFSPQFIENKLKFSQYVREAVVFGGDDFPYVTAMINIDFGNVGKWAENHKTAYTTYTDLSQKPNVYDLIRREVERTNADLPGAARIRKFLLLHKELDADDAELTRTRKVRRGYIASRYQELIDALYGDYDEARITSTITYQDGRTQTLDVAIRIEPMEPVPGGVAS